MTQPDAPPRSRVWLGAFDAQNEFVITSQARLLTSAAVPGGSDPVPAHITTLTIGCLLLQAFTTDFVLAEAHSLPEYDTEPSWPYSQALVRILPRQAQVIHWPPSHHVTNAVLEKVVNWGRSTGPPS